MFEKHTETHVSLHVKCPLLFSNFSHKWNMSTYSSKLPNQHSSHSWVAAWGQTAMVKLRDEFLQLFTANVPETGQVTTWYISVLTVQSQPMLWRNITKNTPSKTPACRATLWNSGWISTDIQQLTSLPTSQSLRHTVWRRRVSDQLTWCHPPVHGRAADWCTWRELG